MYLAFGHVFWMIRFGWCWMCFIWVCSGNEWFNVIYIDLPEFDCRWSSEHDQLWNVWLRNFQTKPFLKYFTKSADPPEKSHLFFEDIHRYPNVVIKHIYQPHNHVVGRWFRSFYTDQTILSTIYLSSTVRFYFKWILLLFLALFFFFFRWWFSTFFLGNPPQESVWGSIFSATGVGIVAEELLPGASTTGAADRVIIGDLCSHLHSHW